MKVRWTPSAEQMPHFNVIMGLVFLIGGALLTATMWDRIEAIGLSMDSSAYVERPGTVLEASVKRSRTGGRRSAGASSWFLSARYEYEVDGVRYVREGRVPDRRFASSEEAGKAAQGLIAKPIVCRYVTGSPGRSTLLSAAEAALDALTGWVMTGVFGLIAVVGVLAILKGVRGWRELRSE